MIDLTKIEYPFTRLQAEQKQAADSLERETEAAERKKQDIARIEEARLIGQSIAEEMQRRAHDKIARVVTRCLAAVFDDPYEFNIRFERKRNKTEAVLEFRRDGHVLDDPANEVGGGVLDVAALALRLSCIMVGKPPARRLLVLDEPFGNIRGEANRDRTATMLDTLSEEFAVQVVLNTDIPTYRTGAVLEME